jgi:regulator of protease activity HflC (stomatin/prohibitin superfamily)
MKNKLLLSVIAVSGMLLFTQCKIVRQGEVGVKRTLGKVNKKALPAGPRFFNPFATTVIIMPVRTVNLEVNLDLPSKEGVNVSAEISILYRIDPKMATSVVENIGRDYERAIIMPVFRAAAADVTAKFMAKDMHTGNRLQIEDEIKTRMLSILEGRGFIIESVLMKSIKLPRGLARAIEEKLEAEQDAQRMEFVLLREKQEAERRTIEATGIRDANQIITEGLTDGIIKYKSIEAFRELSRSNNTKIIITDGTAPFMIGDDKP